MPVITPAFRRTAGMALGVLVALAACTTPPSVELGGARLTPAPPTMALTPSPSPQLTFATPPSVEPEVTRSTLAPSTTALLPSPSPQLTPTTKATVTPKASGAGYLVFEFQSDLYMVDAGCIQEPISCDYGWIRLTAMYAPPYVLGQVGHAAEGLILSEYGLAGSPDGKKLAFVFRNKGVTAGEAPWGNHDIYVLDIDVCRQTAGGCAPAQFTRLTTDPADDLYPAWSPDGQTIAFTSERDGTDRPAQGRHGSPRIFTMRPDGSEQRSLLDEGALGFRAVMKKPTWSPDSRTLAFIIEDTRALVAREMLYMVKSDGTELRQLAPMVPVPKELNQSLKELMTYYMYNWPQWSPDGRSILFQRYFPSLYGFYILDVPTGRIQRVDVARDSPYAASWELVGSVSWSPTGRQILCEGWLGPTGGLALFVMQADGSDLTRLMYEHLVDNPLWIR